MRENKFKIGDVVKVKGQFPLMTVSITENSEYLKCMYWNKVSGEITEIILTEGMLELVTQ